MMSGCIAPYNGNAFSSSMMLGVTALAYQQSDLELQTASGVTSDSYAGLGSNRKQALSLEPALTQISAWSGNVTQVQNRLSLTQSTLGQISAISTALGTTLGTLGGTVQAGAVTTVAAQAKQALQTLGGLLNTPDGNGGYLFGTAGSGDAPVASGGLAAGGLAASIGGIVSQVNEVGGAAVLDQTLGLAGSTQAGEPFSAALSVSPEEAGGLVERPVTGAGQTTPDGIVATQGGAASATSTGSPIRDLIRNLMVVSSLSPSMVSGSGYQQLVAGLQNSSIATGAGLADMSAGLGVTQNGLTSQASMLSRMTTAFTSQLDATKAADPAAVSVQLTSVKNQLQASYTVIANMKGMTLADYI